MPLKYLSKFWRTLNIPLINRDINLVLTWSKICVIAAKTIRDADPDANPAVAEINNPADGTFKITDTKLHVPVVTFSTKDYNKLLQQLKTGVKRTIKWNKCRSKMSKQTKTNILNYLIDPAFSRVNKLFVLSFENENDRISFSKFYKPSIEIKSFKVLIDGKSFSFDVPIKNKEESYARNIEVSKNNNYATGNLLDYEYFSKHYKLIATDLSKQIELENLGLKQQIKFIGKLEEDNGATMFFIIEESEETNFSFSQNSVSIM